MTQAMVRGVFKSGSWASVEPPDVERREGRGRGAVEDELGNDLAGHGAELKPVAGEAEGVEQAGGRAAGADHRDQVGGLAFDAGPHPDDGQVRQVRDQRVRHRRRAQDGVGHRMVARRRRVGEAVAAPANSRNVPPA